MHIMQILKNAENLSECLLAKIDVDTAENKPDVDV